LLSQQRGDIGEVDMSASPGFMIVTELGQSPAVQSSIP